MKKYGAGVVENFGIMLGTCGRAVWASAFSNVGIALLGLALVVPAQAQPKALPPVPPQLAAPQVGSVDLETFTVSSSVTNDGGAPVTQRGICWSSGGTPSIFDSKTVDGAGLGLFSSEARGVTAGTRYTVRSYAMNTAGTAYSTEISITTSNAPAPPVVVDYSWNSQAGTNWADPMNWSGGVVPVYSNVALFSAQSPAHLEVNLGEDRSVAGLLFNTNNRFTCFRGGALSLADAGAAITVQSGDFLLYGQLWFGESGVVSVARTASMNVLDSIYSEGKLTKNGTGRMGISTSNNISFGDFVVNEGSVSGGSGIRFSSTNKLIVASGARYNGTTLVVTNEISGSVAASIDGTLVLFETPAGLGTFDLGDNRLELGRYSTLEIYRLDENATSRTNLITFGSLTGQFSRVIGLTTHTLRYNDHSIFLEDTPAWNKTTNNSWSDAANWSNSGGLVPGKNDNVGFVSGFEPLTINLDTNVEVQSIRAAGSNAVVVNGPGQTITLTNEVVSGGLQPAVQGNGGLFVLNCDLLVAPGGRFVTMTTGTAVEIHGDLLGALGSGDFNFSGPGRIELFGSNNFGSPSNAMCLDGGACGVRQPGNLGNPELNLIFTNNGILAVRASMAPLQNMLFSGDGIIQGDSNVVVRLPAFLSGPGRMTVDGHGDVVVAGSSNQLGGVDVAGGRLRVEGRLESLGDVHVGPGARLGGRGILGLLNSINQLIALFNSHLAPGASVGTLTIEGSVQLDGMFDVELENTTSDLLIVRDTLTLGTSSTLRVTGDANGTTRYEFATYSSRSGTFGSFSIPQNYTLVYGTTNLVLEPGGGELGATNAVREGGTVHVAVQAASNTAWIAVSTSDWVTVVSGASGTGIGSVELVIEQNSGSKRETTAWIAGMQYVIHQAGSQGVYLDFDGDAKADVAVFWPDMGQWYILKSSDYSLYQQAWGWVNSTPVAGDYDGDGKYDVAVYAPESGTWLIWQSNSQIARVQAWGWNEAIPVPADYDGDGITDLAVYVPESGTWFIWQSATQTSRIQAWGWNEAEPVPGDYDGDGLTDLAVYSAEYGMWYLWQSATQTPRMQPWGWNETDPVPGDYDGDGLTDVAVFWPDNGQWYAWLSASQTMSTEHWGWNQALPVPADYDGDGKFDRAVYAPIYGMWYLWQSATQTQRIQPWGFEEAEPVN